MKTLPLLAVATREQALLDGDGHLLCSAANNLHVSMLITALIQLQQISVNIEDKM
ncbi:hypothetical protein M2135_001672 [Parabacteroides sp. PF5-9]|nr:hypothetical protein [Parabacteroides sp. PF5-9]